MQVLLIDFETTGPDRLKDRPFEVGCLMVDPQGWQPTGRLFTARMWAADYPDISEGARRVCKVAETRFSEAAHPKLVLEKHILPLVEAADFVLAYNHEFDKTILDEECKRQGYKPPESNWVCGLHHVPYPDYFRCRQLSHLALDHGVQVDPALTHGALADCKIFLELLRATGLCLQDLIDYRDDPWVYLKAEIPKPWEKGGAELNEAAKTDGYAFEKARGTDQPKWSKTWVKRIKSKSLEAEKARKLPFQRSVLVVP